MRDTSDEPRVTCTVCKAAIPEARVPLACSSCGTALHPSCASRIERGPGWGNRSMFCSSCTDRPVQAGLR